MLEVIGESLSSLDLHLGYLPLAYTLFLFGIRVGVEFVLVVRENDVSQRGDREVVLEQAVEIARVAMACEAYRPRIGSMGGYCAGKGLFDRGDGLVRLLAWSVDSCVFEDGR